MSDPNSIDITCVCGKSSVHIGAGARVNSSFVCNACGELVVDVKTVKVPEPAPGQKGGAISLNNVSMTGGTLISGGHGGHGRGYKP